MRSQKKNAQESVPYMEQVPAGVKRLIASGFYIFPVSRGAKYPPCFPQPHAMASCDPKRIGEWHRRYNAPNWAISIDKSGLIVLDVDSPAAHKHDGFATLRRMEFTHGPLPPTYTVRTPSGGKHYYFKQTNKVLHRVLKLGPGVESTGYVVAPGCALTGRGAYRIEQDAAVALAPDWLADYLVPVQSDDTQSQVAVIELDHPVNVAWCVDYLRNAAPPSMQGDGGEFTLLCVAGVLKDMGLSQQTAIDLLLTHYNPRCDPQWECGEESADADRLDKKVANAWTYLKGTQPGARSPLAIFAEYDQPEDCPRSPEPAINKLLRRRAAKVRRIAKKNKGWSNPHAH